MIKRIGYSFTIPLAHLSDIKTSGSLITTRWNVTEFQPGFTRPRQGKDKKVQIDCRDCQKTFSVKVESYNKARLKQYLYIIVGAVLLASLVAWVPLFFDAAGRTVDEHNPDPIAERTGTYFVIASMALVFGFAFFATGLRYPGIKQLRLQGINGTQSRWTKGHKLKPLKD